MLDRFTSFQKDLNSFQMVKPSKIAKDLAKILFSISILWIGILLFVPWQQTSLGIGRVVAYSPTDREQTIDAPIDGRVERWYVYEGSQVNEGDPIVQLRDNDPEIIRRLHAEQKALSSRQEAAHLASETAKLNLDRQLRLQEVGLSARRSYELAKLEYAKYLAEEANARADLVRLETRLARQNAQYIRAPKSGFILRRHSGESSALVRAGEPLAVLVPNTESRAVELWISGNDIALMRMKQKVRIQFEGWPAIQLSGWPTSSVGTFSGEIAVIDSTDNGEGKFRVLVIPDPSEQWPSGEYLRQGVRAQGWVLLNKVKLSYELWRKMNGFPPTWIKSETEVRRLLK